VVLCPRIAELDSLYAELVVITFLLPSKKWVFSHEAWITASYLTRVKLSPALEAVPVEIGQRIEERE